MIITRAKVVIAGVLRTITVVVVARAEIVIVAWVIWTVVVSVVVPGAVIVVVWVIWTVVVSVVVPWTEAIVGPRGSLLIVIVTEPVTASRTYVGVVVSSAPRSYCGMIPCLI